MKFLNFRSSQKTAHRHKIETEGNQVTFFQLNSATPAACWHGTVNTIKIDDVFETLPHPFLKKILFWKMVHHRNLEREFSPAKGRFAGGHHQNPLF